MKRTSAYLGFFLLALVYSACQSSKPTGSTSTTTVEPIVVDTAQPLTTIAFGSCNKHDEPQPLWADILAQQPDLWVWLGDNVYGDTKNMRKLAQKYREQLARPEYQELLTEVPVIGTWDDHDYGVNDGGKAFGPKEASRDLMLEFLHVPQGRPVWDRQGAYQSYTFGPAGQRVKVLLLDTRYFRDELLASTEDRESATAPTPPATCWATLSGNGWRVNLPTATRRYTSSAAAFRCWPKTTVLRSGLTFRNRASGFFS